MQPSLVIIYFGGNDSIHPHPSGLGPHVPLEEYLENMRKIANHLKVNQNYFPSLHKIIFLPNFLYLMLQILTQIIMFVRAFRSTFALYFSPLLPSMNSKSARNSGSYKFLFAYLNYSKKSHRK